MHKSPQARNFWLEFSGTRIFWVHQTNLQKNIAKFLSQCKIGRVAAGAPSTREKEPMFSTTSIWNWFHSQWKSEIVVGIRTTLPHSMTDLHSLAPNPHKSTVRGTLNLRATSVSFFQHFQKHHAMHCAFSVVGRQGVTTELHSLVPDPHKSTAQWTLNLRENFVCTFQHFWNWFAHDAHFQLMDAKEWQQICTPWRRLSNFGALLMWVFSRMNMTPTTQHLTVRKSVLEHESHAAKDTWHWNCHHWLWVSFGNSVLEFGREKASSVAKNRLKTLFRDRILWQQPLDPLVDRCRDIATNFTNEDP